MDFFFLCVTKPDEVIVMIIISQTHRMFNDDENFPFVTPAEPIPFLEEFFYNNIKFADKKKDNVLRVVEYLTSPGGVKKFNIYAKLHITRKDMMQLLEQEFQPSIAILRRDYQSCIFMFTIGNCQVSILPYSHLRGFTCNVALLFEVEKAEDQFQNFIPEIIMPYLASQNRNAIFFK